MLARPFLRSPEADVNRVNHFYTDYLGRAGTAPEVQGWVQGLQTGLLSPDLVAQAFLASDERFAR